MHEKNKVNQEVGNTWPKCLSNKKSLEGHFNARLLASLSNYLRVEKLVGVEGSRDLSFFVPSFLVKSRRSPAFSQKVKPWQSFHFTKN